MFVAHRIHRTLQGHLLFFSCPRFLPHSKASNAFVASSLITDNNVETLTSCSCLSTPVATSYLVHAFFHAFQLVAKLLSITNGLGVGASLQAACRFEWWVIFLELASLLHERAMLLMTL